MIVIDGSQGEGGGQIFRTSLTLAMCLKREVQIINIRAGREKPGLLRQHLTCLRAAQTICSAYVEGAELGSTTVVFKPGTVKAGRYHFSVGSAGSSTLVFQTVFAPLSMAPSGSQLLLEGGTHNDAAPSVDFIRQSFLPILNQTGWQIDGKLLGYGFYPSGGGSWRVTINPASEWKPLQLCSRPVVRAQNATVTSAKISKQVAERELAYVRKKCCWNASELAQNLVQSPGPGNVISLRLQLPTFTSVFEAYGKRGMSSERVAGRAVKAMRDYLDSDATVCEHLADQLILPMVLGGGGEYTTTRPSSHLMTNIAVVKQMTGTDIALEQMNETTWKVKL